MSKRTPVIWTDAPAGGGTGVQMSKVYPPPSLRWLVWHDGEIVRFCESVDQAFAWCMMIQSNGVEIIDTLHEIANNLDRRDTVPAGELERKEEGVEDTTEVRGC